VLHRSDEWIFGPEADHEVIGDVGRVVFPCGWIIDEATDSLLLYYGAADMVVCLATAKLSEVMARVLASPSPRRKKPRPMPDEQAPIERSPR
jgi:predicted GH43/DUF377 family glycosyl hydrolase